MLFRSSKKWSLNGGNRIAIDSVGFPQGDPLQTGEPSIYRSSECDDDGEDCYYGTRMLRVTDKSPPFFDDSHSHSKLVFVALFLVGMVMLIAGVVLLQVGLCSGSGMIFTRGIMFSFGGFVLSVLGLVHSLG